MTTDIHSCSYQCHIPACIKAQRAELLAEVTRLKALAAQPVQPVQPAAMSQELWIKPDAPDLIAFINSTPVIQSLLYDLNLLPEQVDCEKHWNYMVSVYDHLRPQDAIAQEPVQPITVESSITQLVEALCQSKGWMHAYADAKVRDVLDATSPPHREWVGLTDVEATKLWDSTDNKDSWELLKRVEAKLKVLNT